MSVRRQRSEDATINLTPMIDVVFLLVIFFMVGSKFSEAESRIKVNVPSVGEMRSMTRAPDERIVAIGLDGSITLDGTAGHAIAVDANLATAARQLSGFESRRAGRSGRLAAANGRSLACGSNQRCGPDRHFDPEDAALNDPAQLWADPRLIYTVAATAVALLLATIWLFRRRRRQGRQAGVICLIISIALHAALIFLVPLLQRPNGGSSTADQQSDDEAGVDTVSFSTFDPDMTTADASGDTAESPIVPLPVSNLTDLIEPTPVEDEGDPAGDESQEEMAETPPADDRAGVSCQRSDRFG